MLRLIVIPRSGRRQAKQKKKQCNERTKERRLLIISRRSKVQKKSRRQSRRRGKAEEAATEVAAAHPSVANLLISSKGAHKNLPVDTLITQAHTQIHTHTSEIHTYTGYLCLPRPVYARLLERVHLQIYLCVGKWQFDAQCPLQMPPHAHVRH